MTPRAWVKIDKYGPFQVRRETGLGWRDLCVLLSLVLLADWRSHEWRGTITQLGEDLNADRRAVAQSLRRLVALGLVTEVEPFGYAVQGVTRVACYDDLVVPNGKRRRRVAFAQDRANSESTDRADYAQSSRDERAHLAQNGANSTALTSANADLGGSEEVEGSGAQRMQPEATRESVADDPQRQTVGDLVPCVECGAPATPACSDCRPYCDNCATAPF